MKVQFQAPNSKTIIIDGGLDLISAPPALYPGSMIAGSNVEMVSGRQGLGRPGGFERCCDDVLPSETELMFLKIKDVTGGAIAVDDLFTSGTMTFRALDAVATPTAGDIIVVATNNTGFAEDDVCASTAAEFAIDEIITDLSAYSSTQLRAYIRQSIEQTRDEVPEIPGTDIPNGGFRLRGENYVFRDGVMYRGIAGDWEEVEMPQIMYFDEGVSEIEVGDNITDGTATATVSSVTRQTGSWNYTYAAVDQSAGYFTLEDVSGSFTADANIFVGETVPNIVNGTFTGDSGWTKGTGWTLPGTVADCDGTQTEDSSLSQSFTIAAGRSVTITYDLTVSAGSITPFLGATVGDEVSTAGSKTVTLERTTGANTIGFRASDDFIGTIDNVVRVVSIDTVPTITNGSFGADTDWTKGTGVTISAGTADVSGAQTAVTELSQVYVIDQGRSVSFTFKLSSVSSDATQSATPFLGASEGTAATADGTYTVILTKTTGSDIIGLRFSADFVGKVDDVAAVAGRRAKVVAANYQYVLPTGGDYDAKIYNFTNLADNDSAYGVSGVGEAFDFDGTTYIPIFFPDFPSTFPFLVSIHQERLELGFPGGQFSLSVSGQPRIVNPLLGAVVYSAGSELVGFKKIHGNAQAIIAKKSVWLLLGTGVYDEDTATRAWQFVEHDSSIGGVSGSAADGGPPIFVSGEEMRLIYSTDDTAGYASNPIFRASQPLLGDNVDKISCALWCKKKAQHRLFMTTGTAIYSTFDKGKEKGATPLSFPIPVLKVWSEIEDTVEKIFFLSNTGYLYRMDSGNTFDDGYITGSFRLPFFNYGNGRRDKSFPQMIIGLDSPVLLTGDTEISYTVNHAYGDLGYPRPTPETAYNMQGAGGFYGANAGYGSFIWGGPVVSEILAYLDGIGPNMSILVSFKTRYDNSFTFQHAVVDFIEHGISGRES